MIDQQRQAARFLTTIRRLNPKADVVGYTGGWRHSAEMRAKTRLPSALVDFGLLPESYLRQAGLRILGPVPKNPEPLRELLSAFG